jgi:hypothetical protein
VTTRLSSRVNSFIHQQVTNPYEFYKQVQTVYSIISHRASACHHPSCISGPSKLKYNGSRHGQTNWETSDSGVCSWPSSISRLHEQRQSKVVTNMCRKFFSTPAGYKPPAKAKNQEDEKDDVEMSAPFTDATNCS